MSQTRDSVSCMHSIASLSHRTGRDINFMENYEFFEYTT